MKEQFFVSLDANFSCDSIQEVNLLVDAIRKLNIIQQSIAYNITTNIVKEPSCSKCNPFAEDEKQITVKGHIN